MYFIDMASSNTYDAFLSFRGPDTRKSFAGHLYAALTRAGIRTFLDDKELETGKRISAELPTAIEHSSISIVVLSKNYAHSRWCIDELLKIFECMDTRKQLVIPIFMMSNLGRYGIRKVVLQRLLLIMVLVRRLGSWKLGNLY